MEGARMTKYALLNEQAKPLWAAYFSDRSEVNRNRLVEHYWPFAREIAYRAKKKLVVDVGTALDDLEENAAVSLIDMVQRFDPARKVAFTSIAQTRLFGAILDGIREWDWVPRLERRREKSGEVIPARVYSLEYTKRFDDGVDDTELKDDLTDGSFAAQERSIRTTEVMEELMKGLSGDERQIIQLYYVSSLTMSVIGARLGLSESRVSQIHSSILKRMRARCEREGKPTDKDTNSGRSGARSHLASPVRMPLPQGPYRELAGDYRTDAEKKNQQVRDNPKGKTERTGPADQGIARQRGWSAGELAIKLNIKRDVVRRCLKKHSDLFQESDGIWTLKGETL
jgi:RNA polymerase sigma factor for flagellar operon FliA